VFLLSKSPKGMNESQNLSRIKGEIARIPSLPNCAEFPQWPGACVRQPRCVVAELIIVCHTEVG